MKLGLNYVAALTVCFASFSGAAEADTLDLDCVINGKAALGIVDTNAVGQRVFG